MAGFKFLQLSDLHLGRPFTWLPPDKAELRRADQRDLLWRAVQVAIERKLEAIVIAGDLFDVMWKSNRRNLRILRDWIDRTDRRA